MSIKHIDILGINGTPMRVLLIPANEQSVNFLDRPVNNKPILEFYDSRYDVTPDGQFISEYYVETLEKQRDCLYGTIETGLDLYSDVANWKISAFTLSLILNWVSLHSQKSY